MPDWGGFTADGSEAIERRLRAIVEKVAETLRTTLDQRAIRAVVLIGGYGRGEGGVEHRGGEPHPHNNLDLLLITRQHPAPPELKTCADDALAPLVQAHGIGIDTGVISTTQLRRAPCLVMWYDMRFGHKTLLGDPTFVSGLSRFRLDRIEPVDVRNLLVNRGTLLVINALVLRRERLSDQDRRTVIKHTMKAVIGYGDALLFAEGRYHWSYVEKQRRLATLGHVDSGFRELYQNAMEFRFAPNYAAYLDRDLSELNHQLLSQLRDIHLAFERYRLAAPALVWRDYPSAAFSHTLVESWSSPRAVARKLLTLARGGRGAPLPTPRARMGFRAAGPKGQLPVLFPVVAYDLNEIGFRGLARHTLGAQASDIDALRRGYLRAWSVHGDPNFPAVLRKLNLDLEAP